MRKGLLGVDNLNIQLQGYINPAAPEKNEYSKFEKQGYGC